MSLFEPRPDRTDPDSPVGEVEELRRIKRTGVLSYGTLACPECDAPVAIAGAVSPRDPLGCPYCLHAGAVRDFLSLAPPVRPTRVVVRITAPRAIPA